MRASRLTIACVFVITCGGKVTVPCPTGETACNETCVDVASDNASCGSCGHTCGDGQACSEGTCTPLDCGTFATCGHRCSHLGIDPNNCGACGVSCGAGTCVDGKCTTTSCNSGGQTCESSGQCCSLFCAGGDCACAPSNGAITSFCTGNGDCCSAKCDVITGRCL